MIRFMLLLIFSFVTAIQIFAGESFAQTPPAQEIENQFPILQCPGSSEVFKNFRNKLVDLKKSIKATAQCEPVKADVEKLATLVTTSRPDFLKLITQGQSQGLSLRNRSAVEDYVTELTVTTSNLIDVLSGNDACFAEDRQRNSLAFITSLIGEGSKILSLVGGPEGRTIALAADVINGFLKGMDEVKKNRRGFKFDDYDQRIAYTDALCSFFEYRRELDQILGGYDTITNLETLQNLLKDQLNLLQRQCPECAGMIKLVESEVAKGKNTVSLLWTETFQNDMIKKAEAIDKLYKQNLGSHTYRALKTQTWLPERITAIESSQLHADMGLQDVANRMFSIEEFLFDRQVSGFFEYHITEATKWKDELYKKVVDGRELLHNMNEPLVPVAGGFEYPDSYYEQYGWNTEAYGYMNTELFYPYASAVMESLQNAKAKNKTKVESFFKTLDARNRDLKISLDVINQYCMFFGLAGWYDKPEIYGACEGERYVNLKKDLAVFTNYSPNFARFNPSPLPASLPVSQTPAAGDLVPPEQKAVVPEHKEVPTETGISVDTNTKDTKPENITENWIESLSSTLSLIKLDPNYTERSAQPVILDSLPTETLP